MLNNDKILFHRSADKMWQLSSLRKFQKMIKHIPKLTSSADLRRSIYLLRNFLRFSLGKKLWRDATHKKNDSTNRRTTRRGKASGGTEKELNHHCWGLLPPTPSSYNKNGYSGAPLGGYCPSALISRSCSIWFPSLSNNLGEISFNGDVALRNHRIFSRVK